METLACLQQRSNHRLYDLNNIPPKETIREILEAALLLAPIKNGVIHFSIEIFGPEYHEDKLRLCHTSLTNNEEDSIIPYGAEEDFSLIREMLDDCIEDGHQNPFNIQLLAPYLLVFRRREDPRKPYGEQFDETLVNSCVNAGTLAMTISLLSNDQNLHSTFCNCYELCPNYRNNIVRDDASDIMFFMGLGYKKESPKGAHLAVRYKRVNGIEHKEHTLIWK